MVKTIKVSDEIVIKMKKFYKDYLTTTPQHAIFAAKTNGITITCYKSNKVVFQGKDVVSEVSLWTDFSQEIKSTSNTSTNNKVYEEKNIQLYHSSSVGTDEVGTGDYFGPIVVCATYVNKKDIAYFESLGVKDSKKLSDEKIIEIAKAIKEKVTFSLLIVDNLLYNKLCYQGLNIKQILAKLHNKAISNLLDKLYNVQVDNVIIDKFASEKNYFNYLRNEKVINKNVTLITKAENQHISVAISSILSRYAFLMSIDELSKSANITLPLGASSKVDEVASLLIDKIGLSELKKYAKVNFKTTEKAKKLIKGD